MTEHAVDVEPDETRPLLNAAPPSPTTKHGDKSHWRVVLTMALIDLALNSTSQMTLVPITTILQDIVCKKYYARINLDPSISFEDRCKIGPVQSEVAYINAWSESLEIVPTLLLALPYGALADRIGRKPVFLLSIFGCFLSDVWVRVVYWFPDVFPLRAVWLSGLGQAIGGGATTLSSIGYVIIADACLPEDRTTAFSVISAGLILSKMVFVPLGGIFSDPWLPMWISSGLMLAALLVAAAFVPPTAPPSTPGDKNAPKLPLTSRMRSVPMVLTAFLTTNTRLVPILLTFFLFQFGMAPNSTLFLQFSARRLSLSLASASYLLSLSAIIHILVLFIIMPALSFFLLRKTSVRVSNEARQSSHPQKQHHELVKDRWLSLLSAIALAAGTVLFSFTSSAPLFTAAFLIASLGQAFTIPTRSIITSMVEPSHRAVLYTGISILVYGGILAGSPVGAALFKRGMELGGRWDGLPFLVTTGCFVGCFSGVLLGTRVVRATSEGTEEEGGLSDQ